MPSQRRVGAVIDKGGGGFTPSGFDEMAVVEVDSVFGRMLGLAERQRVRHIVICPMTSSSYYIGFPDNSCGPPLDTHCEY